MERHFDIDFHIWINEVISLPAEQHYVAISCTCHRQKLVTARNQCNNLSCTASHSPPIRSGVNMLRDVEIQHLHLQLQARLNCSVRQVDVFVCTVFFDSSFQVDQKQTNTPHLRAAAIQRRWIELGCGKDFPLTPALLLLYPLATLTNSLCPCLAGDIVLPHRCIFEAMSLVSSTEKPKK